MQKIDILGTEYEITESTSQDDQGLQNADGYCAHVAKRIVIEEKIFNHCPDHDIDEQRAVRRRHVLRHELIHAFLEESGLSEYSRNELIVDWIALQFPKMLKAFNEVNAL